MSQYFIIESFDLHEGQLDNWINLSKNIDTNISQAEGFISRDSGVDEKGRVYCLVKWESEDYQQAFTKELMARDDWDEIMENFASIANMETDQRQQLLLF